MGKIIPGAPRLSIFLISPESTAGTRTNGVMPAASAARIRCAARSRSIGLCSKSMLTKSMPALAMTSIIIGEPVKCIMPIRLRPASSLLRISFFMVSP